MSLHPSLIKSHTKGTNTQVPDTCHVSGVTCQVSGVRCYVSGVTCVMCHFQSIGPLGRCFLSQNVRLCVCLCVRHTPFNGLFAPISQSPMYKLFRDSESLGKSNGKK